MECDVVAAVGLTAATAAEEEASGVEAAAEVAAMAAEVAAPVRCLRQVFLLTALDRMGVAGGM